MNIYFVNYHNRQKLFLILTLQMTKVRHIETQKLACEHIASKWWNWDANWGLRVCALNPFANWIFFKKMKNVDDI